MPNFFCCIFALAFLGIRWPHTIARESVNRKWVRIRKQAMTSQSQNGGSESSSSSSNVQFSNPWPGQDNKVPFSSQWGPWNWQQVQQGIGQMPFQPPGIQIYPSQAQWYPNSPEYQGFNPALQNQSFRPLEGVASTPTLFYWPPSTTTYSSVPPNAAPESWGTWSEIQKQGISGGLQKQWQNWYQNADIWAQWQEWLHEKQKQRGTYVDGSPLPASTNYTASDDTGRILVNLLAGFVAGTTPRKVAMYNMRTYYPQYRRDYWIGGRFFNLDPQTTLESYHTCSYDLPPDIDVRYEIDDKRVNEILFQCVKYQETCCKLNCCDMQGRPLYYSGWVGASAQQNNYFGAMNYAIFAIILRFFYLLLRII